MDPELELVVLHPEHFLPGIALTIYSSHDGTRRDYVAARDRCLWETLDPSSARMPPFRIRQTFTWAESQRVNVFLVTLNAEIKFRRYFDLDPPADPLPEDVTNLMRQTMELVDAIYWKPVKAKKQDNPAKEKRKNPERQARPQGPLVDPDYRLSSLSQDSGSAMDEDGGASTSSAMSMLLLFSFGHFS